MKRKSPSLPIIKPAMAATLAVLIMCGLSVRPAQAGYIVTLQQVGSDVAATGSGAIDLTGLTGPSPAGASSSRITPASGVIVTAAMPGLFDVVDTYSGIGGPTSFGSGSTTIANSGSGDNVELIGASGLLAVPAGYVSGTALSDSSTYDTATFSSLGVTPGIYVWSWGTGANQNFTLDIGTAGVPDSGSTFGLLLLSFVGLFGASRFRSQQSA